MLRSLTPPPPIRPLFFGPSRIGRDEAVLRSEQLASLQVVMASIEHLANDRERRPGGVNDWEIVRGSMRFRSPLMRRVVDALSQPGPTNIAHALRLMAAATLLTPYGGPRLRGALGGAIAVSSHLLATRQHYGGDGSDHAAVLVHTLSSSARAARRRPRVVDAMLWGISLQGVLAYGVSGWVKLAGSPWREHRAIPGVMRTVSYGNEHVYRVVRDHPWTGRVIGVGTLALESSFPLVLLGRGWLTKPFLAAAGSMHLGIAAVMGLGRFVPAFFSLYPALLYTTAPRREAGPGQGGAPPRADVTPAAVAAGTLAAFAGLAVTARRRAARMRKLDELASRLTTRAGNTLAHRLREPADPGAPLLVCENGLMATAEFWSWFVAELEGEFAVLTYDPAGYGTSTRRRGLTATPDTRAADLADLVAHTRGSRPVVLVGHSLGGHVVTEAVARGLVDATAVVLVDPTHPQELARSAQQRAGAERLDESLRVAAWSVRLGLGSFLEAPPMAAHLPERVRAAATLKQQDAGLWIAGVQEWTALREVFERAPAAGAHDAPALVLTAGDTEEKDPEMGRLHDDLASAPGSRRARLEGATHDAVLTHRRHARRLARHVRAFVDDVRGVDPVDGLRVRLGPAFGDVRDDDRSDPQDTDDTREETRRAR